MLAKLEADAARVKHGIIDTTTMHVAKHHQESLAKHVEAFQRFLTAKGNTAHHVRNTVGYVRAILAGCRFTKIPDLNPGRVMEYLADRRARGLSVGGSNHYLRGVKTFSAWLVRDGRAIHDVLKHLSAMNSATDRRRERRALSQDDFDALLKATLNGKPYRCLAPYSRYMLYLTAASTGFRVAELASLTPESFDLDANPPTVEVAGRLQQAPPPRRATPATGHCRASEGVPQ